tara:strand:+ start:3447 stop:4007 length:561 start_codon:yes stop_codon:yes gene_type:complete
MAGNRPSTGLNVMTVQEATNKISQRNVIRVTPTIPIGAPTAFAGGDTMTESLVEIPNAVLEPGGCSKVTAVSVFTKDTEVCGCEVIFFENNSTSAFGTANAAPSISDANALANNPLGTVLIKAGDQEAYTNFAFGTSGADGDNGSPIGVNLKAAEGSTSVYFVVVSRDTAELASTTDMTFIFHIDY